MVRRKLHRAVLVHVDQLARRHVHAADRDRHVDGMDGLLAMARGHAAQHVLELELADGIDVARRAVGQEPDAADRHHLTHHHLARQPCPVHQVRRPFLLDHEDRRLRALIKRVDNIVV